MYERVNTIKSLQILSRSLMVCYFVNTWSNLDNWRRTWAKFPNMKKFQNCFFDGFRLRLLQGSQTMTNVKSIGIPYSIILTNLKLRKLESSKMLENCSLGISKILLILIMVTYFESFSQRRFNTSMNDEIDMFKKIIAPLRALFYF